MATLEDKILGEKLHNYCSSSESDDGEDSKSDSEDPTKESVAKSDMQTNLPEPNKWEGSSTNTGPKGVINDWQRFKQLESERRKEDDKERIHLMKKLTLTVKSALDEEADAKLEDDPELSDLMQDDEFLLDYRKQRMQELMRQIGHNIKFGKLIQLSDGGAYLDAIDKEDNVVKVIIHLYEQSVDACRTMNACLGELAAIYESVKFCAIQASKAGLSNGFKANGVPALLVYRAGQMLGNFVRLSDELGDDFCTEDLQGYLIEHGMLEDKNCTPFIIKKTDENSDSD